MNSATVFVGLCIAAAFGCAIRSMIKKKGHFHCGGDCSHCRGCSIQEKEKVSDTKSAQNQRKH